MTIRRPVHALVVFCAAVLAWSAYKPHDYATWFFETFIGVGGVIALALTHRRFRFSNLAYLLVAVHFTILAAGGKYTYALNPWFDWIRETFGLARNHFDRVGHFAQGFVPAIIARELLLRTSGLQRGKWLSFVCIAICLAMSAFYELIEWWAAALFYPAEGPEWLGMQGDIWDAQQDMAMALLGATLAILLLSRMHDRSMRKLGEDDAHLR